jgi:hypothetical protein
MDNVSLLIALLILGAIIGVGVFMFVIILKSVD